jgi:methyltransferase of FxLD system
MVDPSELRARMIDQLKRRGLQIEPPIEEAFRTVPREAFLPGIPIERVYSGDAIVTKQDDEGRPISSSSEVGVMIAMAQLLDVAPGQRILEIGAGTGYNAAVLSRLVGDGGAVTTIDIDSDVAAAAREHLKGAGFDRVAVITGDGWEGSTLDGPYDRIEVTASVADLSPNWFAGLADRGKIVLPLVLRAGMQTVIGLERKGTELVSTNLVPGGFMRLRGPGGPQSEVRSFDGLSVELADAEPGADDRLRAILRAPPRITAVPPLGWEALTLLALLHANITVTGKGRPGFAVGIVDRDGLAMAELAQGAIAGPLSLISAFGSDAARARLLAGIESVRALRLDDLRVVVSRIDSAGPDGDVVLRRGAFKFAFSIAARS